MTFSRLECGTLLWMVEALPLQDAHYSGQSWLDYFSIPEFLESVDLIKTRLNCIETPFRSKCPPLRCPFRCGVFDTLGHRLQGCPTTHDFRITCHDYVVYYIIDKLHLEPSSQHWVLENL